jgi:quercetin dioxygenase-like cupin family protein
MSDIRTLRRVVTGLDADGRSIVVRDEVLPTVPGASEDGRRLVEIWATHSPRAAAAFAPSSSEIRVVDLPPGGRRDMHVTDTVDYGIVLEGELWLLLERGETCLRAGDVVVQRGTLHGWHNRSDRVTRIAFVNLAGQADDPDRCPEV